MKKLIILFAVAAISVLACHHAGQTSENRDISFNSSSDSLFLVTQGPFNFSVLLPKKLIQSNLPMIVFKESTGELIVSLGTEFSFKVTQEIKTMKSITSELVSTDVFEYEIVESDSLFVLAHRRLTDGTHVSYYFSRMIKGPNSNYFAQSDDLVSFNLDQIKLVQKSIQSIHPL